MTEQNDGRLSRDHFKNDIFISYAHIDNAVLEEGQKGWVAGLHRVLDLRLAQLLGKKARIWRDPKLDGNEDFANRLSSELPKAALLVSVLSPRYLRSDWCRRELDEFMVASETSGGLKVAEKSRIFKVVKTPIALEDQPSELQRMLGYEFFVTDPETGRPTELDPVTDPELKRQYWSRINDLAYDISQMIELFETPVNGGGADAAAHGREDQGGQEEQGVVYLSETSYDLKEERDALRRDLMLSGFRVLPEDALPLNVEPLSEAICRQLAGCRLSIHPVGRNFGIVPEGTTQSIPMLQNELAAEASVTHGLERLIWIPPGLEIEDPRQLDFIERLKTEDRLQSGSDLFETPLEALKTEVRERLRPKEETADTKNAAGEMDDDDLVRVYLICDQRDEDAAVPLVDHLFDQGYEVILPAFEGDEAQVRLDHEENLVHADAVLFYYGAGNDLWLRRKLREVQKSAGFGRQKPLLARAIYVAPPFGPRKSRFRTREARVLQGDESFSGSSLDPFIRQIEEAPARNP